MSVVRPSESILDVMGKAYFLRVDFESAEVLWGNATLKLVKGASTEI